MPSRTGITRRQFALAAGLGATSLMGVGCVGPAVDQEQEEPMETGQTPVVVEPADKTAACERLRVFDLHCDTLDTLGMHEWEPYASTPQDCHAGDLFSNDAALALERMSGMAWCQCFAIWVPDVQPDPLGFFRAGARYFAEQCDAHPEHIVAVRDPRAIDAVLDSGKVAALLTVENAAPCNDDIRVLDEFAAAGVKIVTLTWNAANAIGGGSATHAGLTTYGRQVVAALEDRGIVCDASHLSDESFADLLACHRRPFIATHSNSRAVCAHRRNLTDDQFCAIRDAGGLVGVNYYRAFISERSADGACPASGEVTFDELAAHIEHFLNLGGEDTLALGSDYDGSDVPAWLNGCEKAPTFYQQLETRFGDDIARKIFYTNARDFWVRYEDEATRG